MMVIACVLEIELFLTLKRCIANLFHVNRWRFITYQNLLILSRDLSQSSTGCKYSCRDFFRCNTFAHCMNSEVSIVKFFVRSHFLLRMCLHSTAFSLVSLLVVTLHQGRHNKFSADCVSALFNRCWRQWAARMNAKIQNAYRSLLVV